jgi:hypothetical protein
VGASWEWSGADDDIQGGRCSTIPTPMIVPCSVLRTGGQGNSKALNRAGCHCLRKCWLQSGLLRCWHVCSKIISSHRLRQQPMTLL